jgi:hypothetical protein
MSDKPEKTAEEQAEQYANNEGDDLYGEDVIYDAVKNAFLAGYTAALKSQSPVVENQWVSVKEKMPEMNQFTFFYWGGRLPIIGCYKGNGKWLCGDGELWIAEEHQITHWMKLPSNT